MSLRRSKAASSRRSRALVGLIATACLAPAMARAGDDPAPRVVDLSLMVAPEYPCTWPTFPRFQLNAERRIGPASAYNADILIIDGNTGTQLDVPPHSVTPPDSGLPNAGPFGRAYTDVVPAWQFGGEACVIDCRDLIDAAPPGRSALVRKDRIMAWEKAHRPLGPGDVVVFASGYSDRFCRPLPEGKACLDDPLNGRREGWPAPGPDAIVYLAQRGIRCVATDAPDLGGVGPKRALMTYWALGGRGLVGVEYLTNLARVPDGACFLFATVKVRGCHGSPGRAIALY